MRPMRSKKSTTLANQIQNHNKTTNYTLMIRWTARHEDIEGNEIIDREAKRAAEGLASIKELLPAYLRKPLLMNPSAVKRAYSDQLKSSWGDTWRKSIRGSKMHQIDTSTLSNKFLKAISMANLSHRSTSLISQLRLTHIPFNGYLKQFKRADSARCPMCGADNESIGHFLLTCPGYAHERWALAQQVKKIGKPLSLKSLLEESSLVIPLANYISAMHCFMAHSEHMTSQT